MRTLWRSTASILRKYPIVWLPVILAEVINFNVRWIDGIFRHWLTRRLLGWLSEGHSVLNGSPIYAEPTQHVIKVAVLVAPLRLATFFLCDFIIACALVATSAILYRTAQSGHANLSETLTPIADSSRRIFVFSLIFFGLNIVVGSLGCLVVLLNIPALQYRFESLLSLSLKSSIAFEKLGIFPTLITHLWVLPFSLCLVYLIAPMQLSLVQPLEFVASPNQKRQARHAAIVAALASFLLGIHTAILEPLLSQQLNLAATFDYPIWITTTLINALPYPFLYVALYFIANPDSPLAATPEVPFDLPSLPESPPPSTSA